jgi:hypothetical protein
MTYQVLLEFETLKEAKRFCRSMLSESENDTVIYHEPFTDDPIELVPATLIGAYRKSEEFCDNTDGHRGKLGWTRGPNYGWWVCGACGKPTKEWNNSLDRERYALGINLLPPPFGRHDRNDLVSKAIWRDLAPDGTSKAG